MIKILNKTGIMEDHALDVWARSAVENVVEVESPEAIQSDNERTLYDCLLSLGQNIFNITITDENEANKSETMFKHIIHHIKIHFGLTSVNDDENDDNLEEDINKLLKYCLIAAVSQSCIHQNSYIQNILQLETNYQTILMEIIQNGSAATTSPTTEGESEESVESSSNNPLRSTSNDDYDGECDDDDKENCHMQTSNHYNKQQQQSNHHPRQSIYPHDENYTREGIDEDNCIHCYDKNQIISNHEKQIQLLVTREKDLEIKLKNEMNVIMNKLVDAEVLIIEKDRVIINLNNQLEALNKQINEIEEKLRSYQSNSTTIASLQDQIDILLPQAEKVTNLENQIVRLREKCDEQSNLKQQLKQESSAHAETHKLLINYETELETLRKLKPLVDEYRAKHAESMIELDSLKLKLIQYEEQFQMNQVQYKNALNHESNGLEQTQRLAEELNEANEKLRQLERGQGIGEGIR